MKAVNEIPPRSLLYVTASNARAIEKSRELDVDMIILDLEDAVKHGMKDEARRAAQEIDAKGIGKPIALRINGPDSSAHKADLIAAKDAKFDYIVIPKVEEPGIICTVFEITHKPILAMIETPAAIMNLNAISKADGLAGLIVGTNDLAHDMRLPNTDDRAGLSFALQSIVMAARANGIMVFDGVFNDLNNEEGLRVQCEEGRALGFDGKTLIHPNQIEITNQVWSPSAQEIEDAQALVAAASGGAERFRDRMIENMHLEMAKRLLSRVVSP